MEPKEQSLGNKEMPKDPKPSDEVQLNIETVTPQDSKGVQETEISKTEQSEGKPKEKTGQGNKKAHPAADELSKEDDNPNDARDQVETINP